MRECRQCGGLGYEDCNRYCDGTENRDCDCCNGSGEEKMKIYIVMGNNLESGWTVAAYNSEKMALCHAKQLDELSERGYGADEAEIRQADPRYTDDCGQVTYGVCAVCVLDEDTQGERV